MPLIRAVPLSGLRMVQRMCPNVVLPAPLGPSSANNSFGRTSKPTLSSAKVRPNRLLTPSIATAGSDMVDDAAASSAVYLHFTAVAGNLLLSRMAWMVPSRVSEAIAWSTLLRRKDSFAKTAAPTSADAGGSGGGG